MCVCVCVCCVLCVCVCVAVYCSSALVYPAVKMGTWWLMSSGEAAHPAVISVGIRGSKCQLSMSHAFNRVLVTCF